MGGVTDIGVEWRSGRIGVLGCGSLPPFYVQGGAAGVCIRDRVERKDGLYSGMCGSVPGSSDGTCVTVAPIDAVCELLARGRVDEEECCYQDEWTGIDVPVDRAKQVNRICIREWVWGTYSAGISTSLCALVPALKTSWSRRRRTGGGSRGRLSRTAYLREGG